MNESIITKFNGTLSNSRLPKLGDFIVEYIGTESPTADSQTINLILSEAGLAEIVEGTGEIKPGGDMSATGVQSLVIPANTQTMLTVVSTTGCKVRVSDKYKLTKLTATSSVNKNIMIDSKEFRWLGALKTFYLKDVPYINTNIEDLPSSIESLTITRGVDVRGNVNTLAKMTSLSGISINVNPEYGKVTGDIASLGGLISLANMTIFKQEIYGSVETLLESMHINGKRTDLATFNLFSDNGNVTLNGNKMGSGIGVMKVEFAADSIVIKDYTTSNLIASCSISGSNYTWTYVE